MLTIGAFIVRVLGIEGLIEAATVDPTYDLLRHSGCGVYEAMARDINSMASRDAGG